MIKIKEVRNLNDLRKFVQFYYDLYRDCKQAVPFLYGDEMKTLRKDRNPSFECCGLLFHGIQIRAYGGPNCSHYQPSCQ